ncbi:MAG: PDZ domain-containing protein [Planctomycetota bacterium]
MRTSALLLLLASVGAAQGSGGREQNAALAGIIVHEKNRKVVVQHVLKKSPAEKAGLRRGDVLLQVGERKMERHNDLDRALAGLAAKDAVKVRYERAGKPAEATLKLVAHRGFKSDYLRGPGRGRTGYKAPDWSAFAWVNVPSGKKPPTLAGSRGKVVVFHCFQSW